MKYSFLIFLLIPFFQNAICQNYITDTLPPGISSRQIIIQNRIETVTIHTNVQDEKITRYFNFDTLGQTKSILILDQSKNILFESTFFYNQNGQWIRQIDKNAFEGSLSEFTLISTNDHLGRPVKLITVKDGDTLISTLTYLPKNIIQETVSNSGIRIINDNRYDDQNRKIKIISKNYDNNDSVWEIITSKQFIYDKKGNMSLEIDSSARRIDSSFYHYDGNNRIKTITKKNSIEMFYYNVSGLVIKRKINRSDNYNPSSIVEIYEYVFRKSKRG